MRSSRAFTLGCTVTMHFLLPLKLAWCFLCRDVQHAAGDGRSLKFGFYLEGAVPHVCNSVFYAFIAQFNANHYFYDAKHTFVSQLSKCTCRLSKKCTWGELALGLVNKWLKAWVQLKWHHTTQKKKQGQQYGWQQEPPMLSSFCLFFSIVSNHFCSTYAFKYTKKCSNNVNKCCWKIYRTFS